MTKKEVKDLLINYEAETRKGWYSYHLSNGRTWVKRDGEPSVFYTVSAYTNRVFRDEKTEIEPGIYDYWKSEEITFEEMPDADDYHIADPTNCPYSGMIKIKDADILPGTFLADGRYQRNEEVKVSKARRGLNNIKIFIGEQEDWKHVKDVNGNPVKAAFCGIGENSGTAVEFHYNGIEFLICTSGYVRRENKHHQHFGEDELLFPYVSNNLDPEETLYVKTTSLRWYSDEKGQEVKATTKKVLNELLQYSHLTADVIDIRHPYKSHRERR